MNAPIERPSVELIERLARAAGFAFEPIGQEWQDGDRPSEGITTEGLARFAALAISAYLESERVKTKRPSVETVAYGAWKRAPFQYRACHDLQALLHEVPIGTHAEPLVRRSDYESLEAELSRAKAAIRELVKIEALRLKSNGWSTTEEENKYLDANRGAAWATARAIATKEPK